MNLEPLAPLPIPSASPPVLLALVDDDVAMTEFLALQMQSRGSFSIERMSCGDELLAHPALNEFECIVLDFQLESENGLHIAERLRDACGQPPPLVMLTGTGDERRAIKAFRSGFADYLPKRHMTVDQLIESITKVTQHARAEQKRQDEFEARLRQAEHTSVFDGTTGFYTQAHVLAQLTSLFELRAETGFAAILVEFAGYDDVVRACGLSVAQQARKAFAYKLREGVRSHDVTGCYGDGRFLCLLDTNCSEVGDVGFGMKERLKGTIHLPAFDVHMSAHCSTILLPSEVGDVSSALGLLEQRLTDPELGRDVPVPHPVPGAATVQSDAVGTRGERRAHPRRRVLRSGKVHSGELSITVDCAVRNISDGGAMLRFETVFRPPMAFELEVVGASRARRHVAVRWQNGPNVGVEFVDEGAAGA